MPIPLTELRSAVCGAAELEDRDGGFAPQRLATWTRPQHPYDDLAHIVAHTSGVRMRLFTAAKLLQLKLRFELAVAPGRDRARHPAVLIVEVAGMNGVRHVFDEGDLLFENTDRSMRRVVGRPIVASLDLGGDGITERSVTVWLPHAAGTLVLGGLADASVRAAPEQKQPRWLHYGSSISHGSDLDDPRSPWPHRVARALNLDLVNLGFAGNAMLDPFVARAMAQTPADLITAKIGINLVNGDAMRRRTFIPAVHGFLDLLREGHPDVPILVISALACPIHEKTPGPVREVSPGKAGGTPRELREFDGTLTLERTRTDLSTVVAARSNDKRLWLLNGLGLLGLADAKHLPDNLHPDDAGHALIAQRFVRQSTVRGTIVAKALRQAR